METGDKGAKNSGMTEKVKMICKLCGGRVDYHIEDSCPE